jgi:hypothetical protein
VRVHAMGGLDEVCALSLGQEMNGLVVSRLRSCLVVLLIEINREE